MVFKLLHIDLYPPALQHIHHIQGDHHGPPQLRELKGEIQVPFNIGGVHHVHDHVRVIVDDEIPRDHFLRRIGRE